MVLKCFLCDCRLYFIFDVLFQLVYQQVEVNAFNQQGTVCKWGASAMLLSFLSHRVTQAISLKSCKGKELVKQNKNWNIVYHGLLLHGHNFGFNGLVLLGVSLPVGTLTWKPEARRPASCSTRVIMKGMRLGEQLTLGYSLSHVRERQGQEEQLPANQEPSWKATQAARWQLRTPSLQTQGKRKVKS